MGLEISPRARVETLGVAQMQLLEIAKALSARSKVLILDEPTATLTPPEIHRLCMSGGKGSMVGTLLGASIMGVLSNGLLLLGMGDFARQMVTGLIIVVAVIIDKYRAQALARSAFELVPARPADRPSPGDLR